MIDSLVETKDMENQMQSEHEEFRERLENVEEKLNKEKSRTADLEYELQSKNQEASYIQEHAFTLKTSLQQQINDRDQEIEKLRTQVMARPLG